MSSIEILFITFLVCAFVVGIVWVIDYLEMTTTKKQPPPKPGQVIKWSRGQSEPYTDFEVVLEHSCGKVKLVRADVRLVVLEHDTGWPTLWYYYKLYEVVLTKETAEKSTMRMIELLNEVGHKIERDTARAEKEAKEKASDQQKIEDEAQQLYAVVKRTIDATKEVEAAL